MTMVRLGIRLTLRGGREAVTRLILTSLAVVVGVTVMLGVLGLFNAYQSTTTRQCWECAPTPVNQEAQGAGQRTDQPSPAKVGEPRTSIDLAAAEQAGATELWNFAQDFYQGTELRRLDVAALGPGAPTIPGLTRVPAPGTYYVSPALSHLLATTPHDRLADRFPGRQVGLIGEAALSSPDELAIVIGHTPDDLKARPATRAITAMSTDKEVKGTTSIYRFAFAFGAVALLLPIVIMVGTATRLSAARREERYAAMRLVGATPRQVAIVASVESFVAAALGAIGGTLLYLALSDQIAKVNVTGDRFFASDVSPKLWGYLGVLILVPTAAALAAIRSLRRVQYDPLAVARKATPKPVTFWRLIPLLVGVALFLVAVNWPDNDSSDAVIYPALVFTMWGIVSAGPWVTMQASRLLSRFAGGAASTLAARRLTDDPRATYRTVSGVTLAVFVGTAVAGILPSAVRAETSGDRAPLTNVLRLRYDMGPASTFLSPAAAAPVLRDLRAMPGVSVIPIYISEDPSGWTPDAGTPPPLGWQPPAEYVSCADAKVLPVLGACAPGQDVSAIAGDELFIDNPLLLHLPVMGYRDIDRLSGDGIKAAAPVGLDLSRLDITTLMVAATDGASLERARTYLDAHAPVLIGMGDPDEWSTNAAGPMTFGEVASIRQTMFRAAQQIFLFGVGLTLFVAGCSIAVATAGGLVERKRPFTLLRLSGTPMAVLRRVVFLESALPLLSVSAMAGGAAYAMAVIACRSLAPGTAMSFPVAAYAVTTATVLIAALAVVLGSMTLLSRMTRSENVRFE
ncbi:ABC transporter permease [Catenulispora subtropica]|uniref:ABC3 transporter permease C-terminal domain-containing protein n=1 Tax=Catenulispora subtropica TaxID=450798 RepID=A0ABP5DXE7_9ACTN